MRRSSGGGGAHWCVGATLLTRAALTFVTPAQAPTSVEWYCHIKCGLETVDE